MYIWGYQTPVFIPNLYDWVKKNFIFSEIFPFLGNKCTFGVPNSSFYPHRVKKTSFLVKFFHFQGTNVHLGVPKSSFYPQFVRSGQKNFIFSEIFPFLGNKCTYGGTKLEFLSLSSEKNFIFSEIFPFLGNKCTFGGTKLQFLSPICTIGSKTSFLVKFFHFQETNVHLGVPNSSFYPNRVKKTSFLVKFLDFQRTIVHLGVPNSSFYPKRVKKKLHFQ